MSCFWSFALFDVDTTTMYANPFKRNGRDYITTAMTGAMNLPRPGAIDHFVWVTMTKEGPKIANLMLNGIVDKKVPPKDDALEGFSMYMPNP